MSNLILAVDDEPLILRAYQRSLGEQFTLHTAEGPAAALKMLEAEEYAVILTDLKMPGMDGVQFLQAARALRPDTVRLMISGHADMGDALNSINQAGVFRLMLKPCAPEQVAAALNAGLEQYRLITAEKQLLEGTLNGAIQALTDILSLLDAEAFGQAQLRRSLAREVALALKQPTWSFEIAAQLAEIGRATLPPSVNEKLKNHQPLSAAETKLVERVPEFSSRLLQRIPRLEAVTQAVLYQDKHFNGAGYPENKIAGAAIPLEARVLHAIKALLTIVRKGTSPTEAISLLKQGPERYEPAVVLALYASVKVFEAAAKPVTTNGLTAPSAVSLAKLEAGMTLRANVTTPNGLILLTAGTRLTEAHLQRLQNFAEINGVTEPIAIE
ncbi:MAG: response regulator [Opitutus sp.]|nr:response regulator [Opitutus sp.]MCS6246718.1 response regulator [Opitutus sp.]MCS6277286.1 response regulator [Opitutus sp.]MCS6300408.1 response regulator [Opitutus sp.]